MKNARRATVGVIAVFLSISGCSSDTPATDNLDLASLPASPQPGIRQEVRGIASGGATINNALQELTRRCMQDAGFDYNKSPAAVDTIEQPSFGITDDVAQTSGYGLNDAGMRGEEMTDLNQAIRDGLSPEDLEAWSTALDGDLSSPVSVDVPGVGVISVPTTGCQAQGREILFGDQETALEAVSVVDNLPIAAVLRAQDDQRIVDLNARWADCMSKAGATGEPGSPDEAISVASDAILTQGPTAGHAVEFALALQDATCEQEIDYASQRTTVEDIYLTQMMTSYESRIAAASEARRAAALQAADILASQ